MIFKISLSSSRSVAAHGQFTAASPSAKRSANAPEPQPARMQPYAPTKLISSRDHQFHARARSRDQHFHARPTPEPHIFHFAVAHTYQNVGRVPPPPPPPPPDQSLISNSWGMKARLQVIITFPFSLMNIDYALCLPELGWHRWNDFQ